MLLCQPCESVQWRHNERDGVSNHQHHDCLLNHLFKGQIKKKHQSSASLTFVRRFHWWPMNSPHKGPERGKCFWWRHHVARHWMFATVTQSILNNGDSFQNKKIATIYLLSFQRFYMYRKWRNSKMPPNPNPPNPCTRNNKKTLLM